MTTECWDAETVVEIDLLTRQAHMLPLLQGADSILEVGSGKGRTLELLTKPGRLLSGVDISPTLLQTAHYSGSGFSNVQADAQQLPLAGASFDIVVAQDVLEHIANWQQALEELFRVARRRVVITVPYQEQIKRQQCPHCGARVPFYGHLHHFGAEGFAAWQTRGQMTVRTIDPPLDLQGYLRKALRWSRRKQKPEEGAMLRCPGCMAFVPPGLRWQRAVDRLHRLITHKPEWLLVVWEIGEAR
jgi:SAM-dependent methyltransferase